jgi:hypothetical protein
MAWFAKGANPSDTTLLPYAMQLVENPEEITHGSFACDPTQNYCGRFGYSIFDSITDDLQWATMSMLWPVMTSGQRTTLAQMIVNDNDTSHNGFSASACTPITYNTSPPGTVTASTSSNQVVGVGTTFTTTLSVGQVLIGPEGQDVIGYIYSITDNTHLLLTTPAINAFTGSAYTYANQWTTGNCGLVWYMKHHHDAPPLNGPAQFNNYPTDYALYGGQDIVYGGGGIAGAAQTNIADAFIRMFIEQGYLLADVSTDAQNMLTKAYQQYHDYELPLFEGGLTPFSAGAGNGYASLWMQNFIYPALATQQSVINGPNLTFPAFKKMLVYPYVMVEPTTNPNGFEMAGWQTGNGGCVGLNCFIFAQMMASYMEDGSNETKQYYGYMRGRSDYSEAGWTQSGRFYNADIYPFYNFTEASASIPTTQYVFKDPDLTYAQCTSTYSLGCIQNMTWQYAVSKTGFGTSDTMLLMKGGFMWQGQDHTACGQWGSFHIYRQQYLFGGDGPVSSNPGEGCYVSGVFGESMIDLNGTTIVANGAFAPISRWASTDPTGDSSSRYTYAMVDLTNTYSSGGNASRVQRHWIHFKKSGSQDYVLIYDDIALSAALAVAPKAYMHYVLQNVAPATAITYSNASLTVSNLQTALGAKLNSSFLPVAGANTAALVVDNANGTYTGGNGNSFRAYMCPSSNGTTCDATKTAGEWVGVFEPVNGTSGSMPAITQLTATNFRVIQIADSASPKVAAFAESGGLYTTASFTSNHSGTGQYLVTGLSPGTYSVSLNGAAILSNQTVNSGDNTLYFESASGVIAVTQTAAGTNPGLTCDLNGDGQVNIVDVQIAVNAALGITTCEPQYQLDGSGNCTVIDVQRIENSALGLGCLIGP